MSQRMYAISVDYTDDHGRSVSESSPYYKKESTAWVKGVTYFTGTLAEVRVIQKKATFHLETALRDDTCLAPEELDSKSPAQSPRGSPRASPRHADMARLSLVLPEILLPAPSRRGSLNVPEPSSIPLVVSPRNSVHSFSINLTRPVPDHANLPVGSSKEDDINH